MSSNAELQEQIRKLQEEGKKEKERRERAEKELAESQKSGGQLHNLIRSAAAEGYQAAKNPAAPSGSSFIGANSGDGEDSEDRPSFLDITNGVDDLAVYSDTGRIVHGPKIVPPLCFFNDVFIQHQSRTNHDFLGSVYGKHELSALRKSLAPFYELDYFMPLTEIIPAVFKLVATVSRLRVKPDDVESQTFLKGDVMAFVAGVMKRAGGAGNDRVAAAYVVIKIKEWKEGFEGNAKKGWKVNKLSPFSPELWKRAIVSAGGSVLLDLRCKDEVDGAVPSVWGAALKVAFGGDSTKALSKVRNIVKDHKALGTAVLSGLQADVSLPSSLHFHVPSSSSDIPQRDGVFGKVTGDTSGGDKEGKGGPPAGGGGRGGKGRKPFRCFVCGVEGHGTDSCPDLHESVKSTGKGTENRLFAAEPYKPGGPTEFCLKLLRGTCEHQKTPVKCKFYHGCALCGTKNHDTHRCKKRKSNANAEDADEGS
jgi:hypothetical protein